MITESEKSILNKVNEIGLQLDEFKGLEVEFVLLAPYLDSLMDLIRKLSPSELDFLFLNYHGVFNVMKMLEEKAQILESELHATI